MRTARTGEAMTECFNRRTARAAAPAGAVVLTAALAFLLVVAATAQGAYRWVDTWTGGDPQFQYPHAVATDPAGNVYVADTWNNRIQKFDNSGRSVKMWGRGVATGADHFEQCTQGCRAGKGATRGGPRGASRAGQAAKAWAVLCHM